LATIWNGVLKSGNYGSEGLAKKKVLFSYLAAAGPLLSEDPTSAPVIHALYSNTGKILCFQRTYERILGTSPEDHDSTKSKSIRHIQ
jgi:hypothetical protein